MPKPLKTETIQWRSRSQWKFLPAGDLNWTDYVTLQSREKDGPIAQARMIASALNAHDQRYTTKFEYRVKNDDGKAR